MVTRATIEGIKSNEELTVKIYAYDEVEEGPDEDELSSTQVARVCTVPGFIPDFKKGDTVFVCIEDNDLSDPIVMGGFLKDKCKESTVGTSRATLSKLTVNSTTKLDEDTSIGKVTKENIKCLEKARSNIQTQLDDQIAQRTELLRVLTAKFNGFADHLNSTG